MFSKVLSRSAVSVLGFVFVMSLCIGLPGAIAEEPDHASPGDGCLFGCPDDVTSPWIFDWRIASLKLGINPFFILKPGYQLVLESEDEKSVETVLCDTKWINL